MSDGLPTMSTAAVPPKRSLKMRMVSVANNLKLAMSGVSSSYDGGDARRMGNYGSKSYGPDRNLQFYDRDKDFVRQQVAENPMAKHTRDFRASSLIGDQGFVPRFDPWPEIQDRWLAASESTQFDANGDFSFLGLQKQWANGIVTDGDILARFRDRNPNSDEDRALTSNSGVGLQLQLMEIDHLALDRSQTEQDGSVTVNGINRNPRNNSILGFYIYRRHPLVNAAVPMSGPNLAVWVPARDILRGHHIDRIGVTRSTPSMKVVLPTLKRRDNYMVAEMDRKEVAARRTHVIEMPGLPDDKEVLAAMLGNAGGAVEGETDAGEVVVSLPENGEMLALPPGWVFKVTDPADVGEGYLPFMKIVGQEIAMGTNQTYHHVTGDTTDANERVMRMLDIPRNQDINFDREEYIIRPLVRPTVKRWLGRMFYVDKIFDPAKYDMPALMGVDYAYPKETYVNRYQEEQANDMRLRNKITTVTRIQESEGENPSKLNIERAMEASTERMMNDPEFIKAMDDVTRARMLAQLAKLS